MAVLTIADVFKIGIGPSSSHTMGPWIAARKFINRVEELKGDRIEIKIYGSLALTGKGHYTFEALTFGLLDLEYNDPKVDLLKGNPEFSSQTYRINLGALILDFIPEKHVQIERKNPDEHPNKMQFFLYEGEKVVHEFNCYSIGGGSLYLPEVKGKQKEDLHQLKIDDPTALMKYLKETKLSIPAFMKEREKAIQAQVDLESDCQILVDQMKSTVVKGLTREGQLPGVLKVQRRAAQLFSTQTNVKVIKTYEDVRTAMRSKVWSFDEISTLISSIAMACNEENASMNTVVTAPTNGACGVIPATLFYYDAFEKALSAKLLEDFLLVSGMFGIVYKNAATISGAVGGCMAEIGVASSMAAAGLTYLKGGSNNHIFMAAEIAMEHHLGLTCDPIAGLVQIPCIERNAMGVIKAITASNIAMNSHPENAVVKFEDILAAMNDTAMHMDAKYKETSLGGLAIKVNIPEC